MAYFWLHFELKRLINDLQNRNFDSKIDKKLKFPPYILTFSDKNTPKSGPFKYENNAQILPKHCQNSFEKSQNITFLVQEAGNGQNYHLRGSNFDHKSPFSGFFISL